MALKTAKLESLSLDELSALYDRVGSVLTRRIRDDKEKLKKTLVSVKHGATKQNPSAPAVRGGKPKRDKDWKYPPVVPKYRNPEDRSQTWAGRGKQPRWLAAQIKAGKKIEDFLIKPKKRGGAV
ncbi:MAG: H-NS histone family protein [Alphaproteobacteria bacterium]|nr:H-NS histone family protein [Alphaproteobacteria bacterium]